MEHETIKQMMAAMIPFNGHLGVAVVEVGDGTGRAELPASPQLLNHVGTQHAAALFAVGEAASGAAMSGALAPMITDVTPVARQVDIRYLKPARGVIRAHAQLAQTCPRAEELRNQLMTTGRAEFAVGVSLRDETDVEVAAMIVTWHVRKRSG